MRFIRSQAGSVVLWFVASLILAAALSPFLHQAGQAFGRYAAEHELAAFWESIGRSSRRADFGRYFSRALTFAALVLLPWMFRRIRRIRATDGEGAVRCVGVSWASAAVQVATGCVIAGGMLWGLGWILELAGAYVPDADAVASGKMISQAVVPAVIVPPLEEWLFRGVLLGFWLGFSRPLGACLGTSAVFAFAHFLRLPEGAVIANPSSPLAGFELLGKVVGHLADPRFFVTDFATLFGIGMILAWTRVRTRSLWFAIGLHAGWILAFKGFNLYYEVVADHPLRPWGVGEDLRSGILPMATLALTALVCHFALKPFDRPLAGR